MESPKMLTTLIGNNPNDEAGEAVVGKAETFGVGQVVDVLESDASDVNCGGVGVDGKNKGIVGVVNEEGNLARSAETGNECFGIEVSGLEHAVGEMKEDAVVIDSMEGLEDVSVQQADSGGNVANNFGAIQVANLGDEEQTRLELSSEGTAEKGSRERKRSKYLSFPFVNPNASNSFRDSSEASGKRNSPSSNRFLGKSIRKVATPTSPGDLKDLKVSPAQLLTELRDTSRGYFYLNGNTILNSTFDFFCEFRRNTFKDGDSTSNWYNEDGTFEKEGLKDQDATLSEIKSAKKRKKSKSIKLEALNIKPTEDQVKDMSLKSRTRTPAAKAVKKSRKRKELAVSSHETNKTDRVLDLNLNGSSPRPHENSSDKGRVTEANSQPKKETSELENGIIKAKPISLVVDLFIDSHSLAGLLESNVERHFGETPVSLNADTNPIPCIPGNLNPANSELVKIPADTELLPTDINSVRKLENPSPTKTSSGLPDLNGNDLDPNSSVTFPKQSFPDSMIPAAASHPAARFEEPPLSVIKSSLKMMTKMLEESGNNISPDMRAKLENDVQGLLKKVMDMTGSSS